MTPSKGATSRVLSGGIPSNTSGDPFAALIRFKEVDRDQNNLPAQTSPLIGREEELRALTSLLQDPQNRLVTLTGPGGSGKTRVSIEVATSIVRHFSGVFFVSLASLTDPNLVLAEITATVGMAERRTDLLEGLKDYLKEKRILLLLDNFEQVISAATLVADLLATCPMLKIIATSRAPLRIRGEYEFPLLPLPTPDLRNLPALDVMMKFPAVELFAQRSRSVRPSFVVTKENNRAVAEICARLDGLPLALELAAACARTMSAEEIVRLLSVRGIDVLGDAPLDLPGRQRTLRSAIAWSYDLLSEWHQRLIRQLSVFAGNFTFESAAAVCDGCISADGVADGLSKLTEVSLIRREETEGESRFLIFNTIREFAFEFLTKRGESDGAQRKCVDYYVDLVERAEPELRGPQQLKWLRRLDLEHDNLRAVLRRSIDSRSLESSLRIVSTLWSYWHIRGHLSEGRLWLKNVLEITALVHTSARAKALLGAGVLALAQFNFSEALSLLQQCSEMAQQLNDKETLAFALDYLAAIANSQGDYEKATTLLDESLEMFRDLRDNWGIAFAFNHLGVVARDLGNYDRARKYHAESLDLFARHGDQRYVARTMTNLGMILERQGDYSAAQKLFDDSLKLSRQLGERTLIPGLLLDLGMAKAKQGLFDDAKSALAESLYLSVELGDSDVVAGTLEELASWACKKGEAVRAARLLGAAQGVRESKRLTLPPAYSADVQQDLAAARAALGSAAFNQEISKGKGMSLAEIIVYAFEAA